MKLVILVIVFLTLSYASLFAALVFAEDFSSHTAGGNVSGTASWLKVGTNLGCTVSNTTPLTYVNYNGGGGNYANIRSGTAAGQYNRDYKYYTFINYTTYPTFYASFLIRLATAKAAGEEFLSLGQYSAYTNGVAHLGAKTSGSGFVLGASKPYSTTPTYGSTVYNFNQTYLVIMKYVFVAGAPNDLMYVWVNPNITTEPSIATAQITVAPSQTDYGFNLGEFRLYNRSTNNPTGAIDGIRLAYNSTSSSAWTDLNAAIITVPVELSSFTAVQNAGLFAQLNWTTQSETNVSGFYLYRNTERVLFNATRIPQLIEAHNDALGSDYQYTDTEVEDGNIYYYWLQSVDYDGSETLYGPVSVFINTQTEDDTPIPNVVNRTELLNAFPNPINSDTYIKYRLIEPATVHIDIFNIRGQIIWQKSMEYKSAGTYIVHWPGKDMQGEMVSSGIYMYRMRSGKYQSVLKLMKTD